MQLPATELGHTLCAEKILLCAELSIHCIIEHPRRFWK